jgi:transposase
MAISLLDGRELPDVVLESLRLRALHGCEQGYTEAMVAAILGVRRETVSRWWSAYMAGGLDALPQERSGRPEGSGRTLNDEQALHLQGMIRGHVPEDWGIASALWTRRAVRDLISKGVRHCHAFANRRSLSVSLWLHAQETVSPWPAPRPRGSA